MSDKPFDPTKPVRTRGGWKARIICTDRNNEDWPIIALIGSDEMVSAHSALGRYSYTRPQTDHDYDLINVEPRVEEYYDVWENATYGPYSNLSAANKYPPTEFERIGIIKVVREGDKIISREVVDD